MPVAAEIGLLLLRLHHLEDVRKPVQPGDEGVVARLAEAVADLHDGGRLELLVADHQHGILEERLAYLLPAGLIQPGEIDPAALGAERPGERMDDHWPKSNQKGARAILR